MQCVFAAMMVFALGASARPQVVPWSGDCDFPAPPPPVGSEPPMASASGVPPYSVHGLPSGTGSGSSYPAAPSSSIWSSPPFNPSASAVVVISSVAASIGASSVIVDPASASVAGSASAAGAVTASAVVPSGTLVSGGGLPASSGTSVLSAAQTVAAGATFDCGMVAYDRGISCTEGEGGDEDAVFMLENGASLSNCIIGPNQLEGVHCFGSCSLTNVWWSAVCEDAFTVKEQEAGETTTISGGGAFGAEDKVLQHNVSSEDVDSNGAEADQVALTGWRHTLGHRLHCRQLRQGIPQLWQLRRDV